MDCQEIDGKLKKHGVMIALIEAQIWDVRPIEKFLET